MKTQLLFIALCLVNFLACKKNEATPSNLHYQFPQEFLDYAFLPLNKELTYKDSASQNEYLTKVTQSEMTTITVTPDFFGLQGAPIDYDVYDLRLTNLSDGSIWLDAEGKCEGISVAMEDSISSILWYPFPVEIIPSIVIEGNTYINVIKASWNNGLVISDPDYFETNYYWAKGAGIVKRTVISGNNIKTETLE